MTRCVADNRFSTALLDRWVRYAVLVLRRDGIQTYESCQGGRGHAFPEPTIRFEGGMAEAQRAVAVALKAGLPVHHLRQFWRVTGDGLENPAWEVTFYPHARLRTVQLKAERAGFVS